MAEAWLGLGSNLGDRPAALARAAEAVASLPETSMLARSSLYATPPWGEPDQGEFLNAALAIETALGPRELLAACLAIERRLGRVRHGRWGPRVIDIDLLAYQGVRLDEPGLSLPHPRLTERAFALAPLAEIAPGLAVQGRAVEEWLAGLDRTGIRRLEEGWTMPQEKVLGDDDVRERLATELPSWTLKSGAIARRVELKGFMRPLLLANAIGHLAERADHHPDLAVSYGSLAILLSTHSAGGITDKDLDLARKIEALLG